MPPPPKLVSVDEVEAARRGLVSVVRPTPCEHSATLSGLVGRPVWLKPEHRQRTGSFKIRGAHTFTASLPDADRLVVAASAGNHGQGVALAATLQGRSSVIFMPEAAPLPKVHATRAYGAEVRYGPPLVDDCIVEARRWAEANGGRFVPPFDDPLVIAGQGTVGLELLEEAPECGVVLVPVGGGGLIAGIAVAVKATRPDLRVVGVEALGAASMRASLTAGQLTECGPVATIADGIAVKSPTDLTLAHVRALVDDIVTVDDHQIARALLLLLERSKQVVEPAAAVGLAALLAGLVPGDEPALVVLSGGNVDPLMLTRLIEYGLSAAGRYQRLRVVVPDRPGALAAVTGTVARQGLNVLSVTHQREGVSLGIDEVEVLFTLETRDPAHGEEVVAALRGAGFHVDLL